MHRGEVWIGAGKSYAGKPRPLLILQADAFDATDSVVVCLITSDPSSAPLFRIPVAASEANGLEGECRVMVDKVSAVPRANLRKRIGQLEHEQLIAVERALLVFLGIA